MNTQMNHHLTLQLPSVCADFKAAACRQGEESGEVARVPLTKAAAAAAACQAEGRAAACCGCLHMCIEDETWNLWWQTGFS